MSKILVNFGVVIKNGLAVILVATALSLAAAEIVLLAADYPAEIAIGWKWDRSPSRSEANLRDSRVNHLGLRGRPISYGPNDFVVVLVGDSQVEAGAIPYEDMPEQILEKLLHEKYGFGRAKVFSVASAGWGQDQELLSLGEYFSQFRADLVLMWFTPINDFWENGNIDRSFRRRAGPLKPTFELNKSGNLELAYPRGLNFKLGLLVDNALAHLKYGDEGGLEQFYTDIWLAKLPPSNLSPTVSSFCPQGLTEQRQIVGSFQRGEPGITAETDEDIGNGRSNFSPFIVPLSLRENYQIRLTRRLIDAMEQLSIAHGAAFRTFFPRRSDTDSSLGSVKCVKDKTSGEYYKTDFTNLTPFYEVKPPHNALLVFDISSNPHTVVSTADTHLNGRGNLLAMDALAKELFSRNILDLGHR
ncbi:MAG: hypothetical protein WA156_12015 [Methylocystis silviterrae]